MYLRPADIKLEVYFNRQVLEHRSPSVCVYCTSHYVVRSPAFVTVASLLSTRAGWRLVDLSGEGFAVNCGERTRALTDAARKWLAARAALG